MISIHFSDWISRIRSVLYIGLLLERVSSIHVDSGNEKKKKKKKKKKEFLEIILRCLFWCCIQTVVFIEYLPRCNAPLSPDLARLFSMFSITSYRLCFHILHSIVFFSSIVWLKKILTMTQLTWIAPADLMQCLYSSTMTPKVHYARHG